MPAVASKCLAVELSGSSCMAVAQRASKWCGYHEEMQGKSLKIYKYLTVEFESFDATGLELQVITILNSVEETQVRNWHSLAKQLWTLANRAFQARVRHHDLFYAGGDDGHKQYLAFLSSRMRELEIAMEACDKRLYHLLLASEELSWIRERALEPEEVPCRDDVEQEDTTQEISTKKTKTKRPRNKSDPDPMPFPRLVPDASFEDSNARRRLQLTSQLLNYFRENTRSVQDSRTKACQRHGVVSNLFRCVVCRTPCLFVRAQAKLFKDVESFICQGDLSVEELEKLWKKLQFGKSNRLGPEMLRNAIADVFRDPEDPCNGGKFKLLGGWVYEKASEKELPPQGWDFMHEFVGCSGCALSVCRTFEEWRDLRRLSVLGPRYPRWSEGVTSLPEILLRTLGVCVILQNATAKLHSVQKVAPKGKGMKTVYCEYQERHWVYVKIGLDDPNATKFIDALHLDTSFVVLARHGLTKEYIHDPTAHSTLWTTRVRSASSPGQRRIAKWTDSMYFKRDILDWCIQRSPEVRFGRRFDATFEVLVMDEKVTPYAEFIDRVAQVLVRSRGEKSASALLERTLEELYKPAVRQV